MVAIIGFDIGGANTKAAFLETEYGSLRSLETAIEYFPIWKKGKDSLPDVLKNLKRQVAGSIALDGIGVTMTAELSDAYETKREGVNHALDCATHAFPDTPIFVLDVEAHLRSPEEARSDPYRIAAANWASTGWMVSQVLRDCIVVDVGSTSTSIIPIINGKLSASGKDDLEKLLNGELVYTGALRTNVAAIVNFIPIRGGKAGVSSELFAQSGDVHLILGNISEEEYTTETADGRGKTRRESMARLARVVCADREMLTEKEIIGIAKYVYERQVRQICRDIKKVYDQTKPHLNRETPVVVTGLGRNFLAKEAARKSGARTVFSLDQLFGSESALASPSVGVAMMVATKLEGRSILWKQH